MIPVYLLLFFLLFTDISPGVQEGPVIAKKTKLDLREKTQGQIRREKVMKQDIQTLPQFLPLTRPQIRPQVRPPISRPIRPALNMTPRQTIPAALDRIEEIQMSSGGVYHMMTPARPTTPAAVHGTAEIEMSSGGVNYQMTTARPTIPGEPEIPAMNAQIMGPPQLSESVRQV